MDVEGHSTLPPRYATPQLAALVAAAEAVLRTAPPVNERWSDLIGALAGLEAALEPFEQEDGERP